MIEGSPCPRVGLPRRALTGGLATALAIFTLTLAAAAPASADITISNVQAAPAQTAAGAHSNFTLSFDLGGSESIRDLDVNLPPGLLGNPNSANHCTEEQFQADSCPASSKVGTQVVNATVLGLLATDSNGEVFNLVAHEGEPARLGIRLPALGGLAGTIRLESPVRIRSESDSGLTSILRDIPDSLSGLPLRINSIALTLNADGAAGKKFMTNPTSCDPALTRLHAVGDGDGTADGEGGFTPTACAALPFAPTLTATVGGPGQTAAHSLVPLATTIEQQPGEAATSSAEVTLPPPLTPNVAALGNACSVSEFQSDTCPDRSVVGQAEAVTPLLPSPLAGPVRSVENPGQLTPKLAVYLNGLIDIRLIGDIELTTGGATTTFGGIPDVPLSRFTLSFAGGTGGLLATTDDLCDTPLNLAAAFTGHSGRTATVTSTATVVGCPAGSGGSGGSAKSLRPIASVALRRLRTRSPLLSVRAKRRAGAPKLRTVKVVLPGGLRFDRGTLPVGVRSNARARRTGRPRRLVLRSRSAKGRARITAVVTHGALRVSRSLRRRVKRHPKLRVVLRTKDVSGHREKIVKRVRAR